MNNEFWKYKKVFLTGGTGFIGSWLAEALANNGADLTVLVNEKDPYGTGAIKNILDKIKIVKGDIRDREKMLECVKEQEIFFHLAAFTQVIYSMRLPEEAISSNTFGTLNILEALRKINSDCVLVYVSTDKVYGEPKYLPIDEEHPFSAKSPYDASKIAADNFVDIYNKSCGVKSVTMRFSNTYGGRDQNILRAVPDFIHTVLNGKPPVIRGNGRHIRDYMYVDDVVNGLLLAAENSKKTNGEAFNLGTERPTSVIDLAEMIIKLSGNNNLKPVIMGSDTIGEINRQYLSFSKAKKILNWMPSVSLEEGLARSIKWYRENLQWNYNFERVRRFYSN